MTVKFWSVQKSKIYLLFSSVVVFIAFTAIIACEKPSILGDGVLPAGDTLNMDMLTDTTFLVDISSVLDDSLVTSKFSYAVLGSYNDPIFGNTRAGFASTVRFEGGAIIDMANIHIDSIYLNLHSLNDTIWSSYGKLGVSQTFSVYELSNQILPTDVVYSRDIKEKYLGSNPKLLGQLTRSPLPNPARDTALHICIGKNNDYLIDKFNTNLRFFKGVVSSDSLFKFFKGIYVQANAVDGALLYIDPYKVKNSSAASNIKIYYSYDNVTRLDSSINLVFYAGTTTALGDGRALEYIHQYPTSILSKLNQTTNITSSYCSPLAGIKTKLKINLGTIFNNPTYKYIINKADLELPVDITTGYDPPSLLSAYAVNTKGHEDLLREYFHAATSARAAYYGGTYFDKKRGSYIFNISDRIQQIVAGYFVNDGLYISSGSRLYDGASVILKNEGLQKIRLRIIYTKINNSKI